ncbi:MAG: hypothetical protein K0R66_1613 [Gammaproteobacteria bacterium]|nr:hypothetical protein [Gammaproteobacteria bacterium]
MSNDLSDLTGAIKALAEPVAKLVEAASRGMGILYEPTAIRRKAKALGDAKLIVENKRHQLQILKSENSIEERALIRKNWEEYNHQNNLESVILQAEEFLPKQVSEKPVQTDWLVAFADYAKKISNEDMQSIWARILAGEVTEPGTFSPRTLNILSQITRTEAELFTEFCSFLVQINGSSGHFLTEAWGGLEEVKIPLRSFSFYESSILQETGLVDTYELLSLVCKIGQKKIIKYGEKSISVSYQGNPETRDEEIAFQFFSLTPVGRQLCKVCKTEFSRKFWDNLKEKLILLNFKITE